jgi:hypothetical protein
MSAVLAMCAVLLAFPAHAQHQNSGPRVVRLHRLAVAARQGSADEVVLPITEIRARRRLNAAVRRGDAARRPALCLHAPVEIRRLRSRAAPRWVGAVTDCSGKPTLRGMAALALLAQPVRTAPMNLSAAITELRRAAPEAGFDLADDAPTRLPTRAGRTVQTPRPTVIRDEHTHDPIVEVTRGARTVHPRMLQLLQRLADQFPGRTIEIVSGYRPGQSTSRHAHARALDLRVIGVRNEALRDFARTLPNVGVGFYPNSVFIHLDVRDPDEGPAYWTDFSGPGETPRYGHWPPTDQDIRNEVDWMATRSGDRLLEESNGQGANPDAEREQ